MTPVKVIIPLYKEQLPLAEKAALDNNIKALSAHPIVFIKPEGTDVSGITGAYPEACVMEVTTEWLGTKKGIAGYNEMMMSADFYGMFTETEYLLICHTDAWIFRDELKEWTNKGYDIVAAPWPTRPRYKRFPIKQLISLNSKIHPGRISRYERCGKVGNGGLSLRRTAALLAACQTYAEEIARFNSLPDVIHNEDIFWATIPKEFNYPDEKTALKFAFDIKPRLCYSLNGKHLPMGCHGYMHKSRQKFWRQFIPF